MHYDIICIGAGILGTNHAFQAASRGKKVLLLERDFKPYEGTVRNFGQIVPSGQALPQWRGYGMRSLEIYKSIQAKTDISIRPNGSAYIASDEQEMQLLEELHAIDTGMRYPSVLMTKEELLQKLPALQADYVRGGLFYAQEISAEPNLLIHRLLEYVTKEFSVDFRNNTTVTHCETNGGKCTVVTAAGEKFTADHVVLCSGREFKILFPTLFASSGMRLSKLQMMQTAPIPSLTLPGNILTGLTIRRYEAFHSCPSYAEFNAVPKNPELHDFGIHILFKQAIDGSFIIGDSHEYAAATNTESLDFAISTHIHELMLDEAKRIMHFPEWKIARIWCGYYATHPDEIFRYTLDGRIHIITGIGGKGMTCSAGYAEQSMQQILAG